MKRRKVEQKIHHLCVSQGVYHNFYHYDLPQLLNHGWIIIDQNVDHKNQCGWVLMEREK